MYFFFNPKWLFASSLVNRHLSTLLWSLSIMLTSSSLPLLIYSSLSHPDLSGAKCNLFLTVNHLLPLTNLRQKSALTAILKIQALSQKIEKLFLNKLVAIGRHLRGNLTFHAIQTQWTCVDFLKSDASPRLTREPWKFWEMWNKKAGSEHLCVVLYDIFIFPVSLSVCCFFFFVCDPVLFQIHTLPKA